MKIKLTKKNQIKIKKTKTLSDYSKTQMAKTTKPNKSNSDLPIYKKTNKNLVS
jgi:hypothetical protein